MGYIYNELKKALGGYSVGENVGFIKDWTPNRVRALMIGVNAILVVNHIGNPKTYDLDMQQVKEDLEKYSQGYRQGSLNNLLKQRQLSCLEEIYISPYYKDLKNVIDLEDYINHLVSDKSRLRYYGYFQGSVAEAYGKYLTAVSTFNYWYALAKDERRVLKLEYKSVENPEWYKNYNLRPQYYLLDSEKGKLHSWFVWCEKQMQDSQVASEQALKGTAEQEAIKAIIRCDMMGAEYMTYLYALKRYLALQYYESKEAPMKLVLDSINGTLLTYSKRLPLVQINMKSFKDACDSSITSSKKFSAVRSLYGKLGVLTDKEGSDMLGLVASARTGEGALDIGGLLSSVCEGFYDSGNFFLSGQMVLGVQSKFLKNEQVPKGWLQDKLNLPATVNRNDKYFMSLILYTCSMDFDSFKSIVLGR